MLNADDLVKRLLGREVIVGLVYALAIATVFAATLSSCT